MNRVMIAALSLSAAGLIGLVTYEGYTPGAVIPTKGDRLTLGFGITTRPDGSPVEAGDRTDPVDALKRSAAHIAKDETALKRCVTAPLSQAEYDILVDFTYQYGAATACSSSIVRRINAEDYEGACRAYRLYRFAAGYDCSTPGNRRCPGVWTRSLGREAKCLAAQ